MMEPSTVRVTQYDSQCITSSPTFYPGLFDFFFNDEWSRYYKWKTSELPWQLRLVGGPGSGKTSFAALAVQDLGNIVKAKPDSIALSIFLSTVNSVDNDHAIRLETAFLGEIEAQLQRCLDTKPGLVILPAKRQPSTKKSHPIHIEVIPVEDEPPQPLRQKIKSYLSHFSQKYLIVDDLDAAWLHSEEYTKVEDTLSWLDTLGVRILVTSRTHRRKNKPQGSCSVELTEEEEDPNEMHCGHRDVCLDDDDKDHVVWWQCVACTEEEDDIKNVHVVCVACRRKGKGCINAAHASSPLSYEKVIAYLDLERHFDDNRTDLLNFIDHHLQSEHGQFLPSTSPKPPYPPLSPIGTHLLPNTHTNRFASQLRTSISTQSGGNILNALCRIEAVHSLSESSIESALELELSDRLPSHLLATFDALVRRHVEIPLTNPDSSKERRMRAALALHAIRIVGNLDEGRTMRFSELKRGLLEGDEVCGHGFGRVLEQEGVEEEDIVGFVVGATGGLLCVGRAFEGGGRDPGVGSFHIDFGLYVGEEYNSFLVEGGCLGVVMGEGWVG